MYKHRHFGCYGLIIKDRKIILVKKANGAYKGKLDLPGGRFENAERPIETLRREIMEEVGVSVKEASLFDADSCNLVWFNPKNNDYEDLHHVGFFYKVKIADEELKGGADGFDSLGASWYDIDSLTALDVSATAWMELVKLGYK